MCSDMVDELWHRLDTKGVVGQLGTGSSKETFSYPVCCGEDIGDAMTG